MSMPKMLTALVALGLAAQAAPAMAQTHALPYAQAGVALDYADDEVRVLYAAVTAKQFDLGFTQQTLTEIENALANAKRNIDRAETLLPDGMSKMSAPVLAVREKIVAAETQLEKLKVVITEQTKALTMEDEEEAEELPPTDWKLMEAETGWLAMDIGEAGKAHGKLSGKLKAKMPGKVKKPRGKRES